MKYTFKNIPLSAIDLADLTYQITTKHAVDSLSDAIERSGIINPPILKQQDAAYTIVSGFRRINACRILGWGNIEARIIEDNVSDLACAEIAIIDNAHQRSLNLIEISRSLRLLIGLFSDTAHLSHTAASLGLPDNIILVEKIRGLCLMPQAIQQAILTDTISLSMALLLDQFDEEDAVAFISLFNTLNLSLNKQREIVTLTHDISLRDSISINGILTSKEVKNIVDDDNLDRTQKTLRIRTYLRQKRMPTLSQAEQTFKKNVRRLKIAPGMNLIPPQNFEGTAYRIQMQFTDLNDLKEQRRELDRLINNPILLEVFKR